MQVGTPKPHAILTTFARLKWRYLSCLAGILGLATSATHAERHERAANVMGTRAELICYTSDKDAVTAAWSDITKRWRELELILSDYRPDSEIMRLSARQRESPATWTHVSADLFELLARCQDLSRCSDGAFDVTVGPLTRIWRQARRGGTVPSDEKLTNARSLVGYQFLELDPTTRSVRFLRPGMRLDFGAIGKGYAADEALEIFRQREIHQVLVSLGGDLAVGAAPPRRAGWRVALAPRPDGDSISRGEDRYLLLAKCGVATSGDIERGLSRDGIRLSHILDPRTGSPLVNSWSVTVIAENGMLADALASILSVMGPDDGLIWLDGQFPNAAVQFHRPSATGNASIANNQFQSFLPP